MQAKVFTVLSIDGGGVRGIVAAKVLAEIERRTGKPISTLFDLVGGTSTGSILAASLTVASKENVEKPRFKAIDLVAFYHRYSRRIFPHMRFRQLRQLLPGGNNSGLYDPSHLEDVLQETLGDARMEDSLTNLMIPATDMQNFRPIWIRHIRNQRDPENWCTMLMRDAVRASTTAPTFFPARYHHTQSDPAIDAEGQLVSTQEHALIDGGFFAGNMPRRLLTQARKLASPDHQIIVVHVGTGHTKVGLSPDEFNKLGPLGLVKKDKGALVVSLAVNMSILDTVNDMKDELDEHFFSIDGRIDTTAPGAPNDSLDDASEENLKALEFYAERLIKSRSEEIDHLCTILRERQIAVEHEKQSAKALKVLADMFQSVETTKSLSKLYSEVARFTCDIPLPQRLSAQQRERCALAKSLNPEHIEQLDRIYRVQFNIKASQNSMMNSFREATRRLTVGIKRARPDPPVSLTQKTQSPPLL